MGWRTAALESGRARGSVCGKGASVGASTKLIGPRAPCTRPRGLLLAGRGLWAEDGVSPLGLVAQQKLQSHSDCPISGARD